MAVTASMMVKTSSSVFSGQWKAAETHGRSLGEARWPKARGGVKDPEVQAEPEEAQMPFIYQKELDRIPLHVLEGDVLVIVKTFDRMPV